MSIKEGLVIEFRDKKKVTSVVCLKVESKTLRVVNESNKEFNLPINKIGHITNKVLNTNRARFELIESLREYTDKAEEFVEEINLVDLWELLKDEETEKYDVAQLTDLYFSEADDTYKKASMFRALIEDGIYFEQKAEGFFTPKEEKVVNQIIQQKKLEEEREQQKKLTIEWLKGIISGNNNIEKPQGADKTLDMLISSAVLDSRDEKYPEVAALMTEINHNIPNMQDFLIDLLVKANIFDPDENLLLREYKIPTTFSKTVLDYIETIKFDLVGDTQYRKDLRSLYTITIDDEETKDIDDAISIEETENGYDVYIHIADAASFIEKDSLVDKEAFSRATTIYLPDRKIEMLPQNLSEIVCSLVESEDRPALTLLVNFDHDNNIIGSTVFESLINVDKKLSYNYADEICFEDKRLSKLFQISEFLKEKRINNGAVILNFVELKLKVDENKNIFIGKYKNNSPTQGLVSELMILTNYLVAEFLYKNKIPAIFRSQEEPSEVLEFAPNVSEIVKLYQQRRLMKKSEVSTVPDKHNGLGIDYYCQMTSPIRRYSDLVIHRQIKSFLREGKPFYNEAEIKEIINFTEHSLNVCNIIQRSTIRYWLCKYLKEFLGYKTTAIVVDSSDDKYIVHLPEILIELPLMKDWVGRLEVNQQIEVVFKDIYLRKGIIIIKHLKNDREDVKRFSIVNIL